ncbi:MAG TPA: TRAP transporter substrate-binding protein DctP [Polyangiales bacterium]|nr:TRAP transporter substrate-binding protein DctP [Polyangiales bacterium]
MGAFAGRARALQASLLAASLLACGDPRRDPSTSDPSASGGRFHLRYASPQAAAHPFSRADQIWIEHVQRASHGRLEIEPFWSGALLSSDQGMLELRHGVADIGAITPIYTRGGAHLLRAQAGFYAGARTFRSQVSVYKCLAREFPAFAHELTGLRVLAVQGGNLPALITRNHAVRSLRDLRSLRLRVPAELTSILQELGVDPVSMPIGEVYSGMAKGVIDGVIAPADTLRSMHLGEVARYFIALEVPRGAYPARAISERALRRLPADLQQLLLSSSAVWEGALEREIAAAHERGVRYAHEHRVHWLELPRAEQQRFDQHYVTGARRTARELAQFGVQGEPILERARALIGQLQNGATVTCDGAVSARLQPAAALAALMVTEERK